MSKEASPVALSTAKVALPLIVTAGAAVGTLAGPKLWKGLKELCWTRVEGSTTDEDRCSLCGERFVGQPLFGWSHQRVGSAEVALLWRLCGGRCSEAKEAGRQTCEPPTPRRLEGDDAGEGGR